MGEGDEGDAGGRFVRLADRRLRSAYRLAGYLLGDASEAEDAVQDAIERAWKGWPRLRDEALFETWFERILINICRDRWKGAKRNQSLDMCEEVVSPADPFRRILDRDDIGRVLRAMSADQRAVLVLRYWRDLSLEEIAYRLDLPLGTVKSRLHYALEAMRGVMTTAAVAEVAR